MRTLSDCGKTLAALLQEVPEELRAAAFGAAYTAANAAIRALPIRRPTRPQTTRNLGANVIDMQARRGGG